MPEIKVVAAGTWSSLFGKEEMTVEDLTSNKQSPDTLSNKQHPLDSLANSLAQSSTSSSAGGMGAQAQMLTMSFIPVISPVLSACHAAEVMARRTQRFTGGSLTLLDAWAAPKYNDVGPAGIQGQGKPFVTDKWLAVGNSGHAIRPRSPGQPDVTIVTVKVGRHPTSLDTCVSHFCLIIFTPPLTLLPITPSLPLLYFLSPFSPSLVGEIQHYGIDSRPGRYGDGSCEEKTSR